MSSTRRESDVLAVDLALSRVVQLGGAVRRAASDSPHGRVATAADPAGAEFNLLSA